MCSWRRKRRRRSASSGSSRRVVERPLTYDELIEIKKRLRRSSIDLDIHNSKISVQYPISGYIQC